MQRSVYEFVHKNNVLFAFFGAASLQVVKNILFYTRKLTHVSVHEKVRIVV